MPSNRTKACEFSKETRLELLARDESKCIFCGSRYNLTFAHYISRAKGGMGIVENGVVLCQQCHFKLDQTIERKSLLPIVAKYLSTWYKGWNEESLRYRR